MTGIRLEIDGEWHDPENLFWLEFSSCGCLAGAMTVRDLFTLEQAEREFNSDTDPAYAKKMKDAGMRWVLATRETYRAVPTMDCPHTPKWGVDPDPTVPGYTYRIKDGFRAGVREKKHLINDGTHQSLCGRHDNTPSRWGDGPYKAEGMGGHVACAPCVAKARKALDQLEVPAA